MRHHVFGRKLGRTKDERRELFRNLVGELILHGRVKTTIAKAKAVRPLIDKLVTKAKKARLSAQREIAAFLSKEAGIMLVQQIAPRFQNRTSGFSRIMHLGQRKGDSAEMVVLEWTEQMGVEDRKKKEEVTEEPEEPKEKKKKVVRKRKVVKKA